MNRRDSIRAVDPGCSLPTDLSCYDDPRVIDALEQYLARCEGGDRPSRQEFLASHPEVASQLSDCLDGLEFVHGIAPQLREESRAEAESRPLSEAEAIPVALGDFHIIREIGRGGMGVVYEATQLSLARRVALKVLPFAAVLDQKQLQRFKNEAQAAATLHHSHIVPVFSVGCQRGVHYYAMQYIEGQTLAQLIAQLRRGIPAADLDSCSDENLDSAQTETTLAAALTTYRSSDSPEFYRTAARIAIQAAEAVHYAHEQGIVHRDIKPSNLMIDDRGHVWIADFGLAQVHGEGTLTVTGDLLGTLRYMSPEQAAGNKLLDHRTDVYSLGVTLYELVTLQPPFTAEDRQQLLRQVIEEQSPSPRRHRRATPLDLETIILKAITKEPEGRYQTAQELAADLGRFLEHKPIRARKAGRADHLRRWIKRNPTSATLIAAVGLLVSMLAVGGPLVAIRQVSLTANEAEARRTAEKALRSAERSRHRLQEVLQRILTRTASALKSLEPAQRELLEDTVAYYDDLLKEKGSEPEVRFEAAVAFSRLGFVYAQGGDRELLEELYGEAFRLLSRLASEFPSEAQYRSELVEVHRMLAKYSATTQESLEHYLRAIDLAQALTAEYPDEPKYKRLSSYCHVFLGYRLLELGRLNDANDHLNRGVDSWRRLADDFGQPDDLFGLAFSANTLGDLYMRRRRFDAAMAEMETALTLHDQLPVLADLAPEVMAARSGCYDGYGRLMFCLQQPERAEIYFRKAISTANAALTKFPHYWWIRSNLASASANLGSVAVTLGRSAEAEEMLLSSVGQWNRLSDAIPRDRNYPVSRAWAQFRLGQVLHWTGRHAEASLAFEEALRRLESEIAEHPENGLVSCYLANTLLRCPNPKFRDPARAAALAEASLRIEDSGSWRLLGEAWCRAGEVARGLDALRRSVALNAGGDAFDLLLSAMAHSQLGNEDEASRWYGKAIRAIEQKRPIQFGRFCHPFDVRDLREEFEFLVLTR